MFPAWVTSDVIIVDEGVGQLGGILPRGVLQIAVSPCGFSSCILVNSLKTACMLALEVMKEIDKYWQYNTCMQ